MDLDKELEELVDQRTVLRDLEKHPGWILLSNLCRTSRQGLVQELVGREARSLDDLLMDNGDKGRLAGMQYVLNLPKAQADFLSEEIEVKRQELEEYNQNQG